MLRKTINIDGKDVVFQSSAAIPRLYRTKFNRDIFKDIKKLYDAFDAKQKADTELEIDDLEIFENVAYIMALHANPTIPPTIEGWLDQFEMFSIYEILPQILDLWGNNLISTVQAKKNNEALSAS